MKITELEKHLATIRKVHGDIDVTVDDADTGWIFKICGADLTVVSDEKGKRVEIGPSYGDEI